MQYASRGDRYENLSPEEYLKMIRPYLSDLLNDHKPATESNNEENDSDADRAGWKSQLAMQNGSISTKNVEETRTIYSKSEPVEISMGSVTQKMSLIRFLIHFYKDFNMHKKHQMIKEANLLLKVLNYYIIVFKKKTLEELNHT